MISATPPVNTVNMTAIQTHKEDNTPDTKDSQPRRRPARRQRNGGLGGSLNLGSSATSGTSMASSRRAQDAAMKSSFTADRRAGLASTHGRLSQSFIEQSGEGLDDDTLNEILKGFDDEEEDKKEESDAVGEMKSMQKPARGGRRSMLQSIESQKSMHFNVQDDSDSDSD